MPPPLSYVSRLKRNDQGFMLLEALVALALLASVITAGIVGLSMAIRSSAQGDETTTTNMIVHRQMELIKSNLYASPPATYPTIVPPDGYAVQVQTSAVSYGPGTPTPSPSTIEKVTITVRRNGEVIRVVDDFKVKR